MATSTSAAFAEFLNRIEPTAIQRTDIQNKRQTTHGYLAGSFGSASDMPLLRTVLIGSADRDTIIRPIDDIDVLAVFSNEKGAYDSYSNDSAQFLQRIRQALTQYRIETVGARGQAVRLFYQGGMHVDIAPVFAWASGGYVLPNGSRGWLVTNPDAQKGWLEQRHADLGNRLRPLTRLLKRWNEQHSDRLKSFHLEVLIATVFSSIGANYGDAVAKFFQWAPTRLNVSDPAGQGGDLADYLTFASTAALLLRLRSAADRAANALAAEARGNHQEAIRLWRIEFGDEFPAYG